MKNYNSITLPFPKLKYCTDMVYIHANRTVYVYFFIFYLLFIHKLVGPIIIIIYSFIINFILFISYFGEWGGREGYLFIYYYFLGLGMGGPSICKRF